MLIIKKEFCNRVKMENNGLDKVLREMQASLDRHDIEVVTLIEPFSRDLMDNNPDKFIAKIVEVHDKAFKNAYADSAGKNRQDPFEAIPWAVYNAVGAVYPYWERAQKDNALAQLLCILDRLNYAYVNGEWGVGHTTAIREPLLLSDIAIARPVYWPGLDEGKSLLSKYPSFFEFQKDLIDENGMFRRKGVYGDFVVAYSLLRSDFCDYGENYVKIAEPSFLERTLKGIVAIRFARSDSEDDAKEGVQQLKGLLPKSVHDRIEPLRKEAGWVDYTKFP